jgi:hypothetical protein
VFERVADLQGDEAGPFAAPATTLLSKGAEPIAQSCKAQLEVELRADTQSLSCESRKAWGSVRAMTKPSLGLFDAKLKSNVDFEGSRFAPTPGGRSPVRRSFGGAANSTGEAP